MSFSSALKRSSQATAAFWKASCRLMRLSTSSTVQPSSALRTNGSWLQSQASAIPASLPNTSTSKTAGTGASQGDGRSERALAEHCSHGTSRTGTQRKLLSQNRRTGQSQAVPRVAALNSAPRMPGLTLETTGHETPRPSSQGLEPSASSLVPTAAHRAEASPSSPATCQLSPGAVSAAERASLRSGGRGAEMLELGHFRVPGDHTGELVISGFKRRIVLGEMEWGNP